MLEQHLKFKIMLKSNTNALTIAQGPGKHLYILKLNENVAAIHIGVGLSLTERKLANALLLNACDKLLENRIHTIPVPVLMAMLEWDESQDIQHLQEALKKLNSTLIQFNLPNNGKVSWHTMTMIAYSKLEGDVCSYSYADFLAGQLCNQDVCATLLNSLAEPENPDVQLQGVTPDKTMSVNRIHYDMQYPHELMNYRQVAINDLVCPNDIDKDGDCGRKYCPICGNSNFRILV